jgi:hypothetical protein
VLQDMKHNQGRLINFAKTAFYFANWFPLV